MGLTVVVDQNLCMSSGKCLGDAPEAFFFGDNELAHATPDAGSLDEAHLVAIARNCPGQAITVTGEGGQVLVGP